MCNVQYLSKKPSGSNLQYDAVAYSRRKGVAEKDINACSFAFRCVCVRVLVCLLARLMAIWQKLL